MRRAPRCAAPAWVGLLLAASWLGAAGGGCGTTDVPVFLASSGADGGPPASVDGSANSLGTQGEFCMGSGPPALIAMTADAGLLSTCPDQLVQRAFRYALCTCDDYVNSHALVTDAFDGSKGPYDPSTATPGGSVGVNGNLSSSAGDLTVGGSLWASSPADIDTGAVLVSGELHAQGELHPTGNVSVAGDAWLAGGIQTTGDLTVHGTLHVPSDVPIDVGGMNFGTPDRAAFQVAPVCDCDPSDFVDVAGVVATYAEHNDDAPSTIQRDTLANVTSDLQVTLPCGRYYLKSIGAGSASIQITIQGRVAIFVAGDVSTSDFSVVVPTGSELDLFVAGGVTVAGVFEVGSTQNPARARTYVENAVNLQSASTLAGNLYAPSATVTIGGSAPTILYGSIFARSVSAGSDLTLHYDESILNESLANAGSTCGD
jgi:hypothetical protein